MFYDLFAILFFISVAINILLMAIFIIDRKKKKGVEKLDKDAQSLLAEILAGPAVVKIELIEKNSILQWRGN